jgi:hypothetical protein
MRDKYQGIIDEERIELAKKLMQMDRNLKRKLSVLYGVGIVLIIIGFIVFLATTKQN